MANQIKFTIGNVSEGYKTVEISIRGGAASYKILRSGLLDVDKKISPATKVSAEWLAKLDALKLFDWEKNYSSDNPDGVQWELNFKDGGKIYRGQGTNAYPENFDRFLDWLDELIPEMEFINRKRLEKITLTYLEESLTLDRNAKTLTLAKKNSTHTYNLDESIKKIFDTCQNFLDGIEIADDLKFGAQINFDVTRHDGSTEALEIFYNENFLPALSNLLEEIHSCADDLTAKIFSPELIDVPKGKYIFCKVQFKGSYKHYTYQTDDETLAVGDVVDVPVGRYNDVNQARIVEIGYFDEYEAPFPIDRIKKIIGKHIATDFENY